MAGKLLEIALNAAKDAGNAILGFYHRDISIEYKSDKSPLTTADHAAEKVILLHLEQTGLPVVSEEGEHLNLESKTYWLVDPLDGTKDFLAGNDEFTINIALIEQQSPVLGIVYAPALEEIFIGIPGEGVWREKSGTRSASVRTKKTASPRMVVSRFHDHPDVEVFAHTNGIRERIAMGSSLKYGRLAFGEAEIFPRLVGSSEWDTAAGQAVLEAAGGHVICWDTGKPLQYGKTNRRNPRLLAFRAPYHYNDFTLQHYGNELL